MSLNMYVIGLREKDELYTKMKKIADACDEANIEYPKELQEYIGTEGYDFTEEVLIIDLPENCLIKKEGGFEFDIIVNKLPKGVKVIGVRASY